MPTFHFFYLRSHSGFYFYEIIINIFFSKNGPSTKSRPSTATDIKVLKVRNGDGQELRDARFVEVIKSAGKRIKSASSDGKLF